VKEPKENYQKLREASIPHHSPCLFNFRLSGSTLFHRPYRKIFSIIFLYIICFSSGANSVSAAEKTWPSIALWPISQQLSQSTVLSIVIGNDGFLWIATLDGISRFDGHEISEFRPHNLTNGYIASSNIVTIFEGESGDFFAATRDAGLLRYSDDTDSFISVFNSEVHSISEKNISAAFYDGQGGIWIGYESGIVSHFSSRFNSVQRINDISSDRIVDFSANTKGDLFLATGRGEIYQLSIRNKKMRQLISTGRCQENLSDLIAISATDDGKIWLGTRGNGLYQLDALGGECRKIDLLSVNPNSSQKANINEILHEPDKGLTWIASDQGIYRIDRDHNLSHFHSGNSRLASNEVFTVFPGKDNLYWIGTYSGLNYLLYTSFESFGADKYMGLHSLVAIDSSLQHGTWIASYDGLLKYDPELDTHISLNKLHPESGFTNNKVMSLHIDSKGIWVGYRSSGLEFYSADEQRISSFGTEKNDKLSSNSISAILTLSNQETLVGTYGRGLNIISAEGKVIFQSGTNNRVIMLRETKGGRVWIGTESGIYLLNIDTREQTEIAIAGKDWANRTKPLIWSMAESPNGDLWLGTIFHGIYLWPSAGVASLDASKIEPIISESSPVRTIYAVQIDDQGMIWCSTNMGLVRIDPDSKAIELFTRHHGLQSSEYDFGVSHKDSMGRLYFGGTKGYYRFHPKKLKERGTKPTVRLTNVALPNSSKLSQLQLSQPTPLQLTHKDYFVTFTFSVLDFLDPDKNQFRYMLDGFDQQWIDNGTRNTATYTNLPPGDYVFRVQGANSAGVWNREGLAINIRVLPPPWLSWWAYCLYSIVTLFVLWLLIRAYDSYAIEKRAAQLAIEKHESENRADDDMQEQLEMQDDLVKSVYRHNIATLALISDYISRHGAAGGTPDESVKRVSALSDLEECMYYQNEGLLADLHKYTDIMISRLIKDATVPPESIISINEVTTKLVAAELASPLSIAIYELLENSFRHAFEAGSQANYVQVTLDVESTGSPVNSQYRLTISDSGIGCPGNIRPDAPATPGFATVSAIAEMLSGNLHISSENGTSVTLVFPEAHPT